MGTASLKMRNATLAYSRRVILEDVSLEINPGEMVGLIGPNASGKSTLIRALSGVLSPRSGEISLNGRGIAALSRQSLACSVAVVPQNPSLPEAFTALEIVLMGRYPHLGLFRYESQRDVAIAYNALEKTGIATLAQSRVSQLSGGERQRVLLARALAQEARFLLLDEPTTHLDIQYQIQVMGLMRGLVQQGLGVLAAMHDFSLAARFCHRLLLLKEGRVWAEGSPDTVLTPENLRAAFGIEALVYRDALGHRLIINPFQRKTQTRPYRLHVIGGGGRGVEVMQRLHTEGYEVTAGVLNEGDTDLTIAQALCHQVVVVPPFATIDLESHQRNLELIAGADCTVLCDVPFGQANRLNLEAAATSKRLILIEETPIEERDFTGGQAAILYHGLKNRARCQSLQDLPRIIEETLTKGTRESEPA